MHTSIRIERFKNHHAPILFSPHILCTRCHGDKQTGQHNSKVCQWSIIFYITANGLNVQRAPYVVQPGNYGEDALHELFLHAF